MKDYIKEYSSRGWVVHPLSSPHDQGSSPGKRPLLKGWQLLKKTPDLSQFPPGCNIGLVCGKASGVTVIDYDNMLFAPHDYTGTLVNARTAGHGHVYFQYDPAPKSQKHHMLGIEILSDGSNAVLPPSVHKTGDVYKWIDKTAEPIDMPEDIRVQLLYLFDVESELKQRIGKCRACFKKVLKDYPANIPDMQGYEGRLFMLAICTDLIALGAKERHLKMFAKLMYREKYDEVKTLEELKYLDTWKTWRCETLQEKLPAYVNCNECVNHKFKMSSRAQTEQMRIVIPASVKELTLIIDK